MRPRCARISRCAGRAEGKGRWKHRAQDWPFTCGRIKTGTPQMTRLTGRGVLRRRTTCIHPVQGEERWRCVGVVVGASDRESTRLIDSRERTVQIQRIFDVGRGYVAARQLQRRHSYNWRRRVSNAGASCGASCGMVASFIGAECRPGSSNTSGRVLGAA